MAPKRNDLDDQTIESINLNAFKNKEFDHKLKEVEKICNSVITKLYQCGALPGGIPGGIPGGMPGGASGAGGPTIKEVDKFERQTVLPV